MAQTATIRHARLSHECSRIHHVLTFSHDGRGMGEECSLPQDMTTEELRTSRENEVAPHPFAGWVREALEVAYDQVRHSLHRMAARQKHLYDVKAVNRKFPVGSWVWTLTGGSTSYRPHRWHTEGTGHSHYLHSRRRILLTFPQIGLTHMTGRCNVDLC